MAEALDAAAASRQLREAGHMGAIVESARLIRHKPGRRFLVEYDVVRGGHRFTLIGKSRAKGLDRDSYELQTALSAGAFGPEAADAIVVPATAGLMPRWNMWLQHKVEGTRLTDLLATPAGPALAARAADAVQKVWRHGVNPRKRHGLPEELRTLHERLGQVARLRPDLKAASPTSATSATGGRRRYPPRRRHRRTGISIPIKYWSRVNELAWSISTSTPPPIRPSTSATRLRT